MFIRRITQSILTVIFLTQSTALFAMDRDVYYIGGSVGRGFVDIDNNSDHGTLMEVMLGQYSNKTDVAFEAAYVELNQYEVSKPVGTSTEQTNYDISGLKLMAAKHFIFTPKLYMNVKGGLIYWQEDTEVITKDQNGSITNKNTRKDTGSSVYLGLGYSYAITDDARANFLVEKFKTGHGDFTNAMLGIMFSLY